MKILALDVGGSGVKHAHLEVSRSSARLLEPVRIIEEPRWDAFEQWAADSLPTSADIVAVSCAGFVDAITGVNHLCSIAGWRERPLRANLRGTFPGKRVVVLNDVEAHLLAHTHECQHPLMLMAVGTSVGLALTDDTGRVVRTRAGWPLEFGAVVVKTSASCPDLWSALGTPGLAELQERHGTKLGAERFGYRIGATLAQYAGVFCPRTVVLSGGAVYHNWDAMADAVRNEFLADLPRWLRDDPPTLMCSPYGREAALVGVARYAFDSFA